MLKLLKHFKKAEWLLITTSVLFIFGQVWLELKIPEYMEDMTKLVQNPNSSMGEIWRTGGWMIACAIASLLLAVIVGFIAAYISSLFCRRLRTSLFNKVDSFSQAEINRFSTPSLITRSTNDITQVQQFITLAIQLFVKAPIMAVWAVIKIAGKGYQWSLVTGGTVLILLIMFTIVIAIALPRFRKIQTLTDNLNKVTRENLTGLRVVRAYKAEDYQNRRFTSANKNLRDNYLVTTRTLGVMFPILFSLLNLLALSIYWIGAHLINDAAIINKGGLFANMIVFSNYSMQIIMSFMMLVMLFIFLPRSSVAARRINEVLATPLSIQDGMIQDVGRGRGEIEFKGVCFRYPEAEDYVLEDINLKIKPGQTVAFIGSTGSGKSTLINLVPRFYDPTQGEILIDNIPLTDYSLKALNNKIGYISQNAVIFKGTIASNVKFGDNGHLPYSDEQMKEAIATAQGKEFVENLTDQYQAAIAQGGVNLSGGQKQRLSIARAICRNPEIYIFDDSFSALDYRTDRQLRSELKEKMKDATCLIVAQRIGTIIDADLIVVLENGKIVGQGQHHELLKTCAVYQEIAYSQLSAEELQ